MELGSRIAFVIGDNARLGVISHYSNDRCTIILDNGTTVPANTNRLRPVNYWKDRVKDRHPDEFRYYDEDKPLLDIFRSKSPVNFGVGALRAMWLWSNKHVFNSELRIPTFKLTTSKSKAGEYRTSRRRGKPGTILISASNHSMQDTFSVVLHEMVHQYNFEVDYPGGNFFPNDEGTHGSTFTQWMPKIKSITGVSIYITKNTTDDVTDFSDESQTVDEEHVAPFMFIIFRWPDTGAPPAWRGYATLDELNLIEATGQISARLAELARNSDRKFRNVYGGISTSKRVFMEFNKISRNGVITNTQIKKIPSIAVIKFAAATAKPMDGYDLPSPSLFE